jgi:hypothetical protein
MACIVSIDTHSIDVNGKNGGLYHKAYIHNNNRQNGPIHRLFSSYITQKHTHKALLECFDRMKQQDSRLKEQYPFFRRSDKHLQQYLVQCLTYIHAHNDKLNHSSNILKSFSQKAQSIDFMSKLSDTDFLKSYMFAYHIHEHGNHEYQKMLKNIRTSCKQRVAGYSDSLAVN